MRSGRIESIAPRLRDAEYALTSDETDAYNCIAWALYDTQQWWWPTPRYACYWPPGVARDNSLSSVAKIFEIHGYAECESASSEVGFEKVAIYEHELSGVEHVARQLQSGEWTSKIGEWEDIRHATPAALEGEEYGFVKMYMRRHRKDWIIQ